MLENPAFTTMPLSLYANYTTMQMLLLSNTAKKNRQLLYTHRATVGDAVEEENKPAIPGPDKQKSSVNTAD